VQLANELIGFHDLFAVLRSPHLRVPTPAESSDYTHLAIFAHRQCVLIRDEPGSGPQGLIFPNVSAEQLQKALNSYRE
jgi:hypothetical protein